MFWVVFSFPFPPPTKVPAISKILQITLPVFLLPGYVSGQSWGNRDEGSQIYEYLKCWVGQKVHLGFSNSLGEKNQTNILTNSIEKWAQCEQNLQGDEIIAIMELCMEYCETLPGEGHGNPLQYSCLDNPMDKGAWQATVRRVAKSQTQLKQLSTAHMCKTLPSEPNLVRSWVK